MTDQQAKSDRMDASRAAAIASLWAALTESAETDTEAQVFLLMFGPWATDRVRDVTKS